MRYLISFFILSIFLSCSPTKKVVTPIGPETFPESWAGVWKGDLDVYSQVGKWKTLPMTLTILPQGDSIQWTIQYDTTDSRPYTMKPLDKDRGVWLVDEHNSIKLEAYLFHNKLISQYVVAGNYLTITEEKTSNTIIFEVLMATNKPVSITGGTTMDEEDIPEVKTYPVKIYQKAILKKQ